MKKVIFSVMTAAIVATGVISVNAQSAVADTTTQATQDSKVKVDPSSLPEPVKAVLASDEYKGWQIVNAYEVKGAVPYYELELKNGDQKNTVKLDKDGKKI